MCAQSVPLNVCMRLAEGVLWNTYTVCRRNIVTSCTIDFICVIVGSAQGTTSSPQPSTTTTSETLGELGATIYVCVCVYVHANTHLSTHSPQSYVRGCCSSLNLPASLCVRLLSLTSLKTFSLLVLLAVALSPVPPPVE